MDPLNELIQTFSSLEPEERLQLLLDYAGKLPPLPDRFSAQKALGLNRIHECQTPVFLFVEADGDRVWLYAEVAEESPTVAGFVAMLAKSLGGRPAREAAELPNDLVQRLGLAEALRMTRVVGLSGVIRRIKSEAARITSPQQPV